MAKRNINVSELIVNLINDAFYSGNYSKKIYDQMKNLSVKRSDVLQFLSSNSFDAILCQITEIDMYLNGAQNLSEAYEWMGKDRVMNFKQYLESIILDVKQYETDRKPGRKKSSTNSSGITDK